MAEATLRPAKQAHPTHAPFDSSGKSDQARFKTNGNPANHITKAIGDPAKSFQNRWGIISQHVKASQ